MNYQSYLIGLAGMAVLIYSPVRLLVWMFGGDFIPQSDYMLVIGRDFVLGVAFWVALIYLSSLFGRHFIFVVVAVVSGILLAATLRLALGFVLPVWISWFTFFAALPFMWVCAWYIYWNHKLALADYEAKQDEEIHWGD